MPKRRISLCVTVAVLAIALGQVALGGAPPGLSLLNHLRQELQAARSLPKGTEAPLPEKDLSPLIGLSRSQVQRALGLPSYCGHDETWSNKGSDCGAASPWGYSWGPPLPEPDSAGPGKIVVTTGGPMLLVLEFLSDKVSAAHWLAQE